MAQDANVQVVEKRNGYEIEWVEEVTDLTRGGNMKEGSYRVLTSRLPRRIIADRMGSLKEAQDIADRQPQKGNQ